LGPREHNQIKFDTEPGKGCSVSFSLKKLDSQEIFNPVSIFDTLTQGLSQMSHMESIEGSSVVFGMSDFDEGEKCKSLQMKDDCESVSPDLRNFGSAKKHASITNSPFSESRNRSCKQLDEALECMQNDDPLGPRMGWVTSPVNLLW
jgi:hypothetical protein